MSNRTQIAASQWKYQKATRKPQSSASAQYKSRTRNINGKINLLKALLEQHAEQQSDEPNHWGYCGDLGYVEEKLDEIIATMSNSDS